MNASAALLPDRSVLEVVGEDRLSFLQGLVTNDVEGLAEREGRFTGLLSPQGKILFDFFVVSAGDAFLIDCSSELAANITKRLALYRLRAKVTIADVSDRWWVGAARGEGAAEWAEANAPVIYPDPRLPALGFRLLVLGSHQPEFSASFADYEAMRIAFAVPEGGKDYAYGDAFPHEACLDLLHGVSFKKGCFVGQEVVSRMQHRGTARTRVLAVSSEQSLPHGGADIFAGGFAVGRLGSVAGRQGIALARVDRVKEALKKGQTFTAGSVAVEFAAPAWASYSLDPKPAGATH
ncbi:MAG: folate-binding protein [Rhodomicrobium sp.]